MAVLSDQEKERARYHLGYLNVQTASSIQLGIPRPLQTTFLVEQAFNQVIEAAVPRVRKVLRIMDDIEEQLIESQVRLAAKQLDGITLRENEPDMLEKEYVRWGFRLADILGVPIYPYSERYRRFGGGVKAGNISVG